MSLNSTPSSERIHIGLFGKRNAGKSFLINAITNQDLAIVSNQKGTTTDPVMKAMELLPLGPVVFIDTPGLDDTGELGEKRVEKAKKMLHKTDIALLVIDSREGMDELDEEVLALIKSLHIPYLVVYNKCDLSHFDKETKDTIYVSSKTKENIKELKDKIALLKPEKDQRALVHDLLPSGSLVILVIPIDASAPKGRLILPQQQVIRDLLDYGNIPVVCRESELAETLHKIEKPALVITDSQAFAYVSKIVPEDIPLTSFSILMARYKGALHVTYHGIKSIDELQDGDHILISEGCTHHRTCKDIGTVKIPNWLKNYTGKNLIIETSSGFGFPSDLSAYKMIIHCGGCMLNEREVVHRMQEAVKQGVPITNYGMAIAYMNGILDRSIQIIKDKDNDD